MGQAPIPSAVTCFEDYTSIGASPICSSPFNGNTVQIVAEQRELPGECLPNAGSPDGLRRFRY